MLAHQPRSAPGLRAVSPTTACQVTVHLGPGRELRVPERAVRPWRASAEELAVVIEVEAPGRARAGQAVEEAPDRRQAAFMRFARALLLTAEVPDVAERLAELAARIRDR